MILKRSYYHQQKGHPLSHWPLVVTSTTNHFIHYTEVPAKQASSKLVLFFPLDFQVINRTVLAYCNYLSCGHKLLNCSYLRATPKLHWSFQELPRKLHALHRRILDNATNLYWSSRGQKNESEKIGKGELLQRVREMSSSFSGRSS